jgi:hypothetical protein
MIREIRLVVMLVFSIISPVVFMVYWHTIRNRWLLLSAYAGFILNYLAVLLNGAQMPVFGVYYIEPGLSWKVADSTTRLPWLVDRFTLQFGDTFSVSSVGDILIYAFGGTWLLLLLYHQLPILWKDCLNLMRGR